MVFETESDCQIQNYLTKDIQRAQYYNQYQQLWFYIHSFLVTAFGIKNITITLHLHNSTLNYHFQ